MDVENSQRTKLFWDISKLKEWDKNPRSITKKDFERLKRQIQKLGQYKPLLITPEGEVIGGNMRMKAYKDLGMKNIWVSIVAPKNENEKLEYALSDNDRAGFYDDDLLANLMPQYDIDWADYAVDMRAPQTLDRFADLSSGTKEDQAPAVAEGEAVSKLGEVYQLGKHRLMCGDTTLPAHLALLMDGNKAQMVFTDPPYNVDYVKLNEDRKDAKKGKGWRYNPIKGDNMPKDEFVAFLTSSFGNLKESSEDFAPWYIWHAHQSAREFLAALDANELADRQCLIWVKQSMILGHGDYQWQHEPCYYAKRVKSGKVPYYGDRTQTTVWAISRDNTADYVHPTQKPVALAAKAIKNSSNEGDIILDGFGSSGTTLIGAEQHNRRCFMVEYDPKYCDVIRKRYANFIEKGDEWEAITPKVANVAG